MKEDPYLDTAALMAEISLLMVVCPDEAHSPRRSLVLVAMAAGIAEVMSEVVPAC